MDTVKPLIIALACTLLLTGCTRIDEVVPTVEPTPVQATVTGTATPATPTATSAQSTITPTQAPPTATRVPLEPTLVPPTQTPVPPTPTPTLKELGLERIAELNWYSNDSLSEFGRDALTANLCGMAVNYPALFEEIVSMDMILLVGERQEPDGIEPELVAAVGITNHLNRIAAIDEASAITLLRLTFLDRASLQGERALALLADLAEVAQDDFVTFLNSPEFPQDIAPDELSSDANFNDLPDRMEGLLHPFLQSTNPDLAERIENQVAPGESGGSTLINGSRLAIFYTEVYEAFSENLRNAAYQQGIPDGIVDLAVLDSSIAARVASMPIAVNPRRSWLALFGHLEVATEFNSEGVRAILDSLNEQGKTTSEHIPTLSIELVGLYDREIYNLMRSLPWIEDGVTETRIERTGRGDTLWIGTGEDESVRRLASEVIYGVRAPMVKLLQSGWLRDEDFSWAGRDSLGYLLFFDREEIAALLDMQFLDTVDGDDSFALFRLDVMDPPGSPLDGPFSDILAHPLIDGEITDDNQCYLERVIEELRPGSSQVLPNPGAGEPC